MKTKNSCYTYFTIVGKFDPDEVSVQLNLEPERKVKIGEVRRDGSAHDEAHWEIGRCAEYDVEVGNQMRKTIAPLLSVIPQLCKLREERELSFYLEIVPTLYANEIQPCLAPPLDVIDFCHATRTEIDIDLYVCDSVGE